MEIIKREIEFENVSEDSEILDFSISSNAPIPTVIGLEVLLHNAENIVLERIRTTGTVIFSHDTSEIIGKVEDVYIAGDKLRAKVRVSNHSEYAGFVKDGTLRNISVGYIVHETNFNKEDGIWYTSKWEPIEISFVAIPADISVGVGRSLPVTEVQDEPKKITKIEIKQEELKMENIDYKGIGKQYGLTDNDIQFAERSQLSETQFQNLLIDKLANKAVSTKQTEPELSGKELRQYDISRAILAKVKGQSVDAGFEMEVSREIERLTGRSTNGIFIPAQVLANRNMIAGDTALGGEFVATVHTGEYLGYAFNQTLGSKIGVRYLPGLTSNITVPKITSAAGFSWVGETGEIALSNVSGSQVTLSPKRGGSSTNYSLQLLRQSTPTLNAWLLENINSAVAVGMDHAIFNGSGSANQPQGVLNAGLTSISGSSFSYATALSFPSTVAVANRLSGNLYFVANPTTAALLKARAKESGYPTYVLDENGMMAGYRVHESNQIGASTVLFGDFSKLLVGQFGGIEMVIDEYTQARSGLVVLTTQIMMDVATLDTNAFAKSTTVS